MSGEILVKIASKEDSEGIAKLHLEYISSGFLSTLGLPFLKLLYQSVIESQYAFCIVGKENEKIIGFISGATDVSKFYNEFLKKNFFKGSIILLSKFFNIKIIKGIFETLLYPAKKDKKLPEAELLSIAVHKNYQGKGISEKLFKKLVDEFKEKNIKKFKVIVGEKLIPACKFYEKMGGIFYGETEIHKKERSRIYVWEL